MKKIGIFIAILAIPFLISSPASAQEEEKGLVLAPGQIEAGLELGLGFWSSEYDKDGESQDYDGSASDLPIIRVNGAYGIIDNLQAGATIAIRRFSLSPDEGDSSSGFGLQNVIVGADYSIIPEAAVGVDFLLDLGKKEEDLDYDELPISDAQHALAIGAIGKKAFGAIAAQGELAYILTLKKDEGGIDVDDGDYINVYGGGLYQVNEMISAGLDIIFWLKTKGSIDDKDLDDSDAYALSVAPKVLLTNVMENMDVSIALQETGEYVPTGITFMGKNAPALLIPVSVSVNMKF